MRINHFAPPVEKSFEGSRDFDLLKAEGDLGFAFLQMRPQDQDLFESAFRLAYAMGWNAART